jgi:hypothetical protein
MPAQMMLTEWTWFVARPYSTQHTNRRMHACAESRIEKDSIHIHGVRHALHQVGRQHTTAYLWGNSITHNRKLSDNADLFGGRQ